MLISFDFDDTLFDGILGRPIRDNIERLEEHAQKGDTIIVVTARYPEESKFVEHCLVGLPIQKTYFTSLGLKGPLLQELGVDLHYDDAVDQLESARVHGIKVVNTYRWGRLKEDLHHP